VLTRVVNSEIAGYRTSEDINTKGSCIQCRVSLGKNYAIYYCKLLEKCTGKEDNKINNTKLIPFSKQDVKVTFDTPGTNLQADNLASWTEADEKTQHIRKEDTAATVKNRRQMKNLEPFTQEITQKVMVMIPVKWW
jgi:hypothetical protein